MVGQFKVIFTATVVLCIVWPDSDADAFQVYSNSRAAASANPTNARSATGSLSRTNRYGLAGGLANKQWSYNTPNGQFRSNTYRRSTSSFGSPNQSPVFNNYTPGTVNRAGTSTYHHGPTRIQRRSGIATFSGPGYYNPHVPGFNGVSVGGVIVNGGFGNRRYGHQHGGPIFLIDPYGGAAYSPHGTGYPWVPGGQVPFGVYAPPIVVPYLNQGLNGQLGTNIVPNAGLVGDAPLPNGLQQPGFAAPGIVQQEIAQPAMPIGEDFSAPIPIDEAPLVNEFPLTNAPTDTIESSTGSRIQSLRYQASADAAYKNADFASAAALYRKAAEEAPERQAPWLRLAFTQVQQNQNGDAVKSLKAALNRNDDPTAAWVSAEMLTGLSGTDRTSLSEEQLFNWLKQRPNSTDRLLLTAAWSEFRGSSSAARELLQMAKTAGLSKSLVRNLNAVITDSHEQDARERREPQPAKPAAKDSTVDSFSDADILLLPEADTKTTIAPTIDDQETPAPSLNGPGKNDS